MKRLILLLDGTWNSDDAANPTNIMRLRKLVEAGTRGESLPEGRQNDGIEQRIYYDNGVGTAGGIDRFLGGVLGVGLSENVRQAYRFLSAFYQPGDEIYVFGFSRGAFTARSLAGFVAAAGLLRKEHCDAPTLKQAWAHYRTPPKQRMPADKARLEAVATDAPVKLLGVFDTVGALGIPLGVVGRWEGSHDQFHDTKLGSAIEHACQALAIDEHRLEFVPALFAKPDHDRNKSIEQVWFPGVHSDVGGGLDRPAGAGLTALSDVALAWMLSRIAAHTGLRIARPGFAVGTAPLEAEHANSKAYIVSRVRPMYRLIGRAPLFLPNGDVPLHETYTIRPPEEPTREAVHLAALDLMAQRPDYRPRNLVGALSEILAGRVGLVGYDGNEIAGQALAQMLDQIDRLLGAAGSPLAGQNRPSAQPVP